MYVMYGNCQESVNLKKSFSKVVVALLRNHPGTFAHDSISLATNLTTYGIVRTIMYIYNSILYIYICIYLCVYIYVLLIDPNLRALTPLLDFPVWGDGGNPVCIHAVWGCWDLCCNKCAICRWVDSTDNLSTAESLPICIPSLLGPTYHQPW